MLVVYITHKGQGDHAVTLVLVRRFNDSLPLVTQQLYRVLRNSKVRNKDGFSIDSRGAYAPFTIY